MYVRFALGLRGFLRRRVGLEDALATIRVRLRDREKSFLRIVERGIYGHPGSPYLALLREAGCELGDLRNMIRDRGLEEALRALRAAGVYVTFEEFKGRVPIERNGREIPIGPRSFDNPFLRRQYETESSGSTGPGTRIPHELDFLVATAPYHVLAYHAHDVLRAPLGLWRGVLPGGAGIHNVLRSVVIGNVVERWFAPFLGAERQPALRFRAATSFVIHAGRLLGASLPSPEPVPLERAEIVARWAVETARERGSCQIRAAVSSLTRIALAALETGIDLTGVVLMGGGEPPTPGKLEPIVRSGARYVPTYVFSEGGPVGMGCRNPADINDVHHLEDGLAIIQHPQRVPGTDREVDAFCFTTLLPTSPRLLLNVEADDFGVLERRSCGCPLEAAGYHTHIRQIRSYRKLTGEGVTLVGSDMIRILEEVLPARFGGSPQDFQLHEREDERGFTRLVLVVHPRVELPDERMAVETVLESLGRGSAMEDIAGALWRQAGTLQIERRPPEWNRTGKFPPLVVDGR